MGWFITERCNLRCKHCCVSDTGDLYCKGELSFEDIKCALYNVKKWGVTHIHFLGGEPTLRDDFLEILSLCRKLGISTSFNTNGQLIDRVYAKYLVRSGVRTVTFSIEGPDAETNDYIRGAGTFERTLKAIEYLKQARLTKNGISPPIISLEIGVNKIWATKSTKIRQLEELILSLNPESVYLEATQPEGRALKYKELIVLEAEEILDIMPKLTTMVTHIKGVTIVNFRFFPKWVEYGNIVSGSSAPCSDHLCLAGTPQSYVSGSGKLIPCSYSTTLLGWDGLPDVRYSTIQDVMNSVHFRKFFELWQTGIKTPPSACQGCGYYGVLCEPCPIAPQEERESGTKFCKEAMQRIAQYCAA
ncbi:radical SAM protein [candidate division WOR-3 bacterium]|nr:radical SAM protein [candidate division WOR-3 bacterium]